MENLALHAPSIAAIAGGALIGLAAALIWFVTAREAAITESLDALASGDAAPWHAVFVAAVIAGALGAAWLVGNLDTAGIVPADVLPGDTWLLAAGAFLVGAGIRVAAGGLAAHGIFGIARLSARSAVAMAVVMLSAIAVATLVGYAA